MVPIDVGVLGTVPKGLDKKRFKTVQTTALLKIGKNTEKSLGDLRILAVTLAPVKDLKQQKV